MAHAQRQQPAWYHPHPSFFLSTSRWICFISLSVLISAHFVCVCVCLISHSRIPEIFISSTLLHNADIAFASCPESWDAPTSQQPPNNLNNQPPPTRPLAANIPVFLTPILQTQNDPPNPLKEVRKGKMPSLCACALSSLHLCGLKK